MVWGGAQQAMTQAKALARPASESTDLERRVLARERILQALIAYMARTESRFIDHLRPRFVEVCENSDRARPRCRRCAADPDIRGQHFDGIQCLDR
jgi:hypothetical protein